MSETGESYFKEGEIHFMRGSLKRAMANYTKGAEKGHSGCQMKLGYCYEYGLGTDKNPEQAVFWYQTSVDHGNREAMGRLGDLYFQEKVPGTAKEEGIRMLTRAAREGDSFSIKKLIRYIGQNKIPVERTKLAPLIDYTQKLLQENECNEIDLIRLIYLENGEMTDAQKMEFGTIFYDLCHYEEAEQIFFDIVKRKDETAAVDYEEQKKGISGLVTAGQRAEYWLNLIRDMTFE